jgi:hypothetical protein
MRRASKVGSLTVAVMGAVALAGCGSGGGASALSAEDLRAKADVACGTANSDIAKLGTPKSVDELKAYYPKALEVAATAITGLSALRPPADLKPKWDEVIADLKKEQTLTQSAGVKIAKGDDPLAALKEIDSEVTAVKADLKVKANELGLKVCGHKEDTSGSTTNSDGTGTADATVGTTAAFQKDGTAFGEALTAWGSGVSSIKTQSDLGAKVPDLRAKTDEAEAALEHMSGYTLKDAGLETKRKALVTKGRELTTLMRELEDKGPTNSESEMSDLTKRVQTSVEAFKAELSK